MHVFFLFSYGKTPKEPDRVSVKIKNLDGSCGEAQVPVQLPHKVLEYLLEKCELRLSDVDVANYWQHHESVGDELALISKEFRDLVGEPVWPVGLHGDDACMGLVNHPYDKITAVSLNLPLFRPKSTRLSRFLLFSLENQRIWTFEDSINPLLRAVVQSLNFCAEVGVASKRFLVTELRGDQVWMRLMFQYKAWWTGHNVCPRCHANTSDVPYISYTQWQPTRRSTQQFLTDELPVEMSFLSYLEPSRLC